MIANTIKKQKNALLTVFVLAVGYILVSALVMFNAEPNTFNNFFEAVYWATTSLTTVGYGDIYPFTSFGKLVIISLVILIIVLIPYQTNDLIQIMRAQSEYAKYTYKASKDIPHIILTGDISIDSLRSFCKELFHPDHGAQYRHAVIVSTQLPSREMEIFLNEKTNKNFIFYLWFYQ